MDAADVQGISNRSGEDGPGLGLRKRRRFEPPAKGSTEAPRVVHDLSDLGLRKPAGQARHQIELAPECDMIGPNVFSESLEAHEAFDEPLADTDINQGQL